jgi:transposase
MAASKFNPDACQAICEATFDGLTIAEAAKAAGVAHKTVKNWLAKGRAELKNGGGPYADFVLSIEDVRRQAEEKKQPMTEDELELVVSESARAGSVAAQKLYYEILQKKKGAGGAGDADPADGFAALDGDDELAEHRARKRGSA